MQIYFDPVNSLHCELLDANGKPAPAASDGGSLASPHSDGFWIALPYDSTIRLRVDIPSKGRIISGDEKDDFLSVHLPFANGSATRPRSSFGINAGDTNVYYLAASFSARSPTNHDLTNVGAANSEWTGTLQLPKMKVGLKRQ